jgi:hypothetical protein
VCIARGDAPLSGALVLIRLPNNAARITTFIGKWNSP